VRNPLLTASQLALGILLSVVIFTPVQAATTTISSESDHYFTLEETSLVIIYGNSNAGCNQFSTDPYLWLYDSDNTLIAYDDDSNHNSSDQCVSAKIYTTLDAGTYRIRAGYCCSIRGIGSNLYDGKTYDLVLDFDTWTGTTTTSSSSTTTTSTSTTSTSTTTAPSTSTTTSTSTTSTSSTTTSTTSTTSTTTSTTSTVPATIAEPPPPPPPPPPTTTTSTSTTTSSTTTTSPTTSTTTTTTTIPPTTTTTTSSTTTTTSTTTTSSTTTTTPPTTTSTSTTTPPTTTVKPPPATDAPTVEQEQIASITDEETREAVKAIVEQEQEITNEQLETVIEQLDELQPETVAAVVAALTEAPDELKEEFETAVNIFEGAYDDYVPTGSTVDVATRRTVTAASVIISGAPTVTARRRTK